MNPYWTDGTVSLHLGKAERVLPGLPDGSVDAIVTDPPYELGFMGRTWDASGIAYDPAMWAECLRVLKPGGHMVAFGGTRTYHRMVCAIEDAGFEVRDSMHWIYGSGFPKSHDIGKAIDKAAGATREVIGDKLDRPGYHLHGHDSGTGAFGAGVAATTSETRMRAAQITAPATTDAHRWDGWGTALKPSHEPVVVARRPLQGTVAANVLEHGTGALNIDGCRVPTSPADAEAMKRANTPGSGRMKAGGSPIGTFVRSNASGAMDTTQGRWPTNVVFSHPPTLDDTGQPIDDACANGCVPDCPVAELDRQSGQTGAHGLSRGPGAKTGYANGWTGRSQSAHGDSGGASRYFPVFRYEAKAPASERPRLPDGTAHTTVKPLALMRWLVRLVTPPGRLVLDPFAGSGTTGEACVIEGFRSLLIEQDPAHAELIRARLAKPIQPTLEAS